MKKLQRIQEDKSVKLILAAEIKSIKGGETKLTIVDLLDWS